MAEGGWPSCAESRSAAATPNGVSQMSGLSRPPASQRRARRPSLQPVMLRMVDDFLVLTPSRAVAEAVILRTMQGAVPPSDCPGSLSTAGTTQGLILHRTNLESGVPALALQRICVVSPRVESVMIGRLWIMRVRSAGEIISPIPCNACRLPWLRSAHEPGQDKGQL